MTPFQLSRSALLAAALALPVGAWAQGTAPANPADTGGTSATHQTTPMADAGKAGRHEDRVEKRITNLHARLKITPAQEQQWNQFAQVMRDNAKQMDQDYQQRSQRVQEMSALDNMQSYAKLAEAHAQDVQKLVPAFEALYNSMSAEQKHTADQVFRSYAERAHQRHEGHHRG
ncbi:MAG: Spy/CpxP family protein refolding chaperone [Alphaproteobacteria bacterium]|nr:Spy/CpxP family protein refolding chaperone [Alphaproteobacteria bacterium]